MIAFKNYLLLTEAKYKRPTHAGVIMFSITFQDNNPEVYVFLIKTMNKKGDEWSIPKGKIKKLESIRNGAFREFEEETGLDNLKVNINDIEDLGIAKVKDKKIQILAFQGEGLEKYNFKKVNTFEDKFGNIHPETVDGKYFNIKDAFRIIKNGQEIFLKKLLELLNLNDDRVMLTEGGKALGDTTMIKQEQIQPTKKQIENLLLSSIGLKCEDKDYSYLGSIRNEINANDVDIAINVDKLANLIGLKSCYEKECKFNAKIYEALENCIRKLEKKMNKTLDYVFMNGVNIFSVKFPIFDENQKTRDFVQVDIVPSTNLDYSKFAYYSPSDSKVEKPGLYRTLLLQSILSTGTKKVLERFDDGEIKREEKLLLDLTHGLKSGINEYISPKTGKRVKTKQRVKRKFISNDVKEIVETILGSGAKEEDAHSVETICERMKSKNFPFGDKIDKIESYYNDRLEKLKLPKIKLS